MRVYLILLIAFVVLCVTDVNAKTNTKQKEVKAKYSKETTKKSKDAETGENQEAQEPAFEKARIRYTKPKSEARVKDATQTKPKKQTGKNVKTVAATTKTFKNKNKQASQDQIAAPKKLKKVAKYTKAANTNEELAPVRKVVKDKRVKRETATNVQKEKLKRVRREEAGVEEESVEACPPCDCSRRSYQTEQNLSNNAEEDITTVETETEEEPTEEEETEENLQCDSLVEGCDV